MPQDINSLSNNAIAQIGRLYSDVENLKRQIGMMDRRRHALTAKQVYAQITDSTGTEYDATQVYYDSGWTPVDNGLEWGSDSTLGTLAEFNSKEDMEGVFPLWQTGAASGDFKWFFSGDTTGGVVYAEITGSTGTEYDATEVTYTGSWAPGGGGRGWGADGTEGPLLEFNLLEDMTGVFPLWHTEEGATSQWWFLGDPRGISDDLEQDLLFDIEYDTNEVDFRKATVTSVLSNGMVQEYTTGAPESAGMITSKEWIKIQGGQIQHVNFDAPWATITHDGTNWSSGGATSQDYTEFNDTRGHLVKFIIDGTEFVPPEDQTNYKYVNCDDEGDFRVYDESTDQVFADNGACWTFLSETTDATDAALPSVDYTDCSDCLADRTAEEWQPCGGGTPLYLDPTAGPDDELAWLCVGGTLQKYEFISNSPGTITAHDYLEQCADDLTDCSDLVGWPGSDSFDGTVCNSGSIGDTNWSNRYTLDPAAPAAIINNKLDCNNTAVLMQARIDHPGYSSDFTYETTFENAGYSGTPIAFMAQASMSVIINGTSYQVWLEEDSASLGNKFFVTSPPTTSYGNLGNVTSGTLKMTRVGNTLSAYGNGGFLKSWTVSGNTTIWVIGPFSGFQCTTRFSSVTLVDGSSNPIYIDPTGNAC
jgi:hypothetical protein